MICNICKEEIKLQKAKNRDQICPNCKSTSDERLFYKKMEKYLKDNTSVLFLNETPQLKNVLENNPHITYHTATHETLKDVEEKSMDIIISNYFIDNAENDIITLNKINDILKENSVLILKENTDLELEKKIEDWTININDNPRPSRLFYGREGSKRVFGKDFITVLENKYEISYENPDEETDNILLTDRLTKDPIIICKPKKVQKDFEEGTDYNTYTHRYVKENINYLLKRTSRMENNEIEEKSQIDYKYAQIKNKTPPVDNSIGELTCNVCNYNTNLEFKKKETTKLCPRCSSSSQSRTLCYYLEHYTDLFSKKNQILHTSEDEGLIEKIEMYQGFNYITANVEEKKLNKEIIDFENIPYPDNTFDYIISSTLLNTSNNINKILEEFTRVLKKEGKIVLITNKTDSLESFKETNLDIKCYDLKKDHENKFIKNSLSDDLIYIATKLV